MPMLRGYRIDRLGERPEQRDCRILSWLLCKSGRLTWRWSWQSATLAGISLAEAR